MASTRRTETALNHTLVEVWQRVLVENQKIATLAGMRCVVRRTKRLKLREVAFQADGRTFVGLEQNPNTRSRWGRFARSGKKVMQFIENGRYVAAVVDGKAFLYR